MAQSTPQNVVALEAPINLSPDEARLKAAQFLSIGQLRAAAAILEVLIARDPKDAASLILMAHAQRRMGNHSAARRAAQAGWRHAEQDVERYGAAIASAQALSSNGNKSLAQLWLRRAAHVAPNDVMRARAIRDYSYVRTTNPWRVTFRFGLNPSDNVNNAPRDNTMVIAGLTFVNTTAIPLNGIETTTGIDLRYTIEQTQTRRTWAELGWDQTWVTITDDDQPAGVEDSDFTYTQLRLGLGRDWKAGPDAPLRAASATLGRVWYGGEHLSDELTLRYRETYPRPGGVYLGWHGHLGYSDRQDSASASGVKSGLGVFWSAPTEAGARWNLSANWARTDTDTALLSQDTVTLDVGYTLGREILGGLASLKATGYVRRDHETVAGQLREDHGLTLATSLFFKDFDTHGFAPKITLSAKRVNSNVTRYETESLGLSIGFLSVY